MPDNAYPVQQEMILSRPAQKFLRGSRREPTELPEQNPGTVLVFEVNGSYSFLCAAKWALTLFFIMVDCLPVLGKLLGGISAYDRLVARETGAAGRSSTRPVRSGRVAPRRTCASSR
jgi:hypothetical protein